MSATTTLIAQIMPLALGAAVSPTALMGIILLLSMSKKPKLQGFGYYIGAIVLILIVVVIGISLGTAVTATTSQPNPILAWFDVIVGILLLILGFKRLSQPQKSPTKRFGEGKLGSNIGMLIKGFTFGFVMFLINFSTTILVLEAGKVIGTSSADAVGKIIVIILLMIITLLVCEIPLLIYLIFPKKANNVLSKVEAWMQKYGHYLMAAVIIVIGIYLVYIGILKLGII